MEKLTDFGFKVMVVKHFSGRSSLRFFLYFLVCTFFFCSPLHATFPKEQVNAQYIEVTGEKEVSFNWQRTMQDDGTVGIVLVEGKRTFVNICSVSGETLRWKYLNGDQEKIEAWRDGDYLHVVGMKNGKPIELKKKIDSRPWFQPLSYSLGNFLKSEERKISFWTIRSNTLDIYAMEAEKKLKEEIKVVSGVELAQVVEIRVKGFLSKFWHCTYWYRVEDGFFLRYQAAHGPVGTEKTTVHVASVN